MSFFEEIAGNLAGSVAGKVRDALEGDEEVRALRAVMEQAFKYMFAQAAPEMDRDNATLVEGILSDFIERAGLADGLMSLLLRGQEPPLELLRERFDELEEYDRSQFPSHLGIDFDEAMVELTKGFFLALHEEAIRPRSPLYNRLSVWWKVRHTELLQGQGVRLDGIERALAAVARQLEAESQPQLPPPGEQPALPPPADEALARYLALVVEETASIRLPFAPREKHQRLPLQEVYVALRVDPSSPVERRAAHARMKRLVRERELALHRADEAARLIQALHPLSVRFLEIAEAKQREIEEGGALKLAEVVQTRRWMVLLGHPGTGKSTLARWLALQLARACQAGEAQVQVPADHIDAGDDPGTRVTLGRARLPVPLPIAVYAAARWGEGGDRNLRLFNFLGRHVGDRETRQAWGARFHELVAAALREGRATLILDGLDEVTDERQRREVVAEIHELIHDWLRDAGGESPRARVPEVARDDLQVGNQLLVTSRIVGYDVHPLHENLPHFVIQPMSERAVRRFCANWAATTGLQEGGEALAEAALEHPNSYVGEQMARNPLLLTILAQVYSGSPARRLPARRVTLYEQAQKAVFQQREEEWKALEPLKERFGAGYMVEVLERVTALVAFRLHAAYGDYPHALAPQEAVERWLREALEQEAALPRTSHEDVATAFLRAANSLSGFFVARGEGVYGFLHRQFQEYFAARHLVRLAKEQGAWEGLFWERYGDTAWQEVLLMAVGLGAAALPDATRDLLGTMLFAEGHDPVGGVLPYNALLAAAALREVAEPLRDREWRDLVRQIALALVHAYRRDDEARFAVVRERVERAFRALPRGEGRDDPVAVALAAALSEPGEAGRLTRLAAAELVMESQWYTPTVAAALSRAWQAELEPAGTLLAALQEAYDRDPANFHRVGRRVRRAQVLWQAMAVHEHWRALAYALYLAPWAEAGPEAVVRDTPLTEGLLRLAQEAPADRARLVGWLWEQWTAAGDDEAAGRDAGLALMHLGEERLAGLLAGGGENRVRTRATLAASYLVLDLHRARARARILDRALARARAPDLDRTLRRARARAITLDRTLDLDLDRTLDRTLDLSHALSRTLAHARALDLDRDLARIRAVDLAHTLARARDLDLDRALDRDLDLDRARLAGIIEAVEAAQQRVNRDKAPTDVQEALASALQSALSLRDILGRSGGVLRVWDSLGAHWAKEEPSLDIWAREARPLLTAARLPALVAQLEGDERSALQELLPRLDTGPLRAWSHPARDPLVGLLQTWLTNGDPWLTRHGALLLGELGKIAPESLPPLVACLEDAEELTRYRAQQTLAQPRDAATLGQEAIEALARLAVEQEGREARAFTLASLYPAWALSSIRHNQPASLQAWAGAENEEILGRVRLLSEEAWPVWLALLRASIPKVQRAMLEATSWLLRLRQAPDDILPDLVHILQALAIEGDNAVRVAAVEALGFVGQAYRPVGFLWGEEAKQEEKERAAAHRALVQAAVRCLAAEVPGLHHLAKEVEVRARSLARLAAAVESEVLRAEVRAALDAALPTAAAALSRLLVTTSPSVWRYRSWPRGADEPVRAHAWEAKQGAALLHELRRLLPGDEAVLEALLEAGADDDLWDEYHERIAQLVRRLVEESDGEVLAELLYWLEEAQQGKEWPPRRITLAAVAACAPALGDALNEALGEARLEELLLEGAMDAKSHDSRRKAITALSYLRYMTPATLEVLLNAGGDIGIVQRDAVQAVARFQNLSGDFDRAEALAPLAEALTGKSLARAYLAAQLLAALGRSPIALQRPGLRAHIARLLGEAWQHADISREVYLLEQRKKGLGEEEEEKIISKGTLSQALLEALGRVVALPE